MSTIVRRLKRISGPALMGLAIALLGSGSVCSFAAAQPDPARHAPDACVATAMPDCGTACAVQPAVVPEAISADTPLVPGDGAVVTPTPTPRPTHTGGRSFAPADAAGSIQEYFRAAHPCRAPPRASAR